MRRLVQPKLETCVTVVNQLCHHSANVRGGGGGLLHFSKKENSHIQYPDVMTINCVCTHWVCLYALGVCTRARTHMHTLKYIFVARETCNSRKAASIAVVVSLGLWR